MLTKVYYLKYEDVNLNYTPFEKVNLATLLKSVFDVASLSGLQLPADIETNTLYNDLFSLVISKYHEHAIIKIVKCLDEEFTYEEKQAEYKKFIYRFCALLNETYEYYTTLLNQYNAAKTHLMDDIRAITSSKVKFNDTPQNPNTSSVYEGDNYITNFTKTEGETSSPLTSKIMRLKEIQENYRDLLSEWVRDFERIFYQEDC